MKDDSPIKESVSKKSLTGFDTRLDDHAPDNFAQHSSNELNSMNHALLELNRTVIKEEESKEDQQTVDNIQEEDLVLPDR